MSAPSITGPAILAEPVTGGAQLGPLELLATCMVDSLAFFVEVMGMTESGRAGDSVFLRGWDDYGRSARS